MKKILLLFGCFAALLLSSACLNHSSNGSVKEVTVTNNIGNAQTNEVNQVMTNEKDLADSNKRLSDKLNTISKDSKNMNDEIASLNARLYLIPDLTEVYVITPTPHTENGWFVTDQIPTLRLIGYDNASQVRFLASVYGDRLAPAILSTDQDPSDGWSYQGPLIGKGNIVVWAEVTGANGNVVQTPVIPVLSNVTEDATLVKSAEVFKNITDIKAVIEKYYQLTSTGNYQSAWELIHPSERDPLSGARNALRQQFLTLQGTKGLALEKIISSKLLDTYKIYVIQILASHVMEVKLKLSDGNEKTIHLLKDSENRWRLFWEPDQGLE